MPRTVTIEISDRLADHQRRRTIPVPSRAVGRYRRQHRPVDDRRPGGLADVERDLIRTRTAEGRRRAKDKGQHMGRPPALTPQQAADARQRRTDGATLKELANSYNVGLATISRLRA